MAHVVSLATHPWVRPWIVRGQWLGQRVRQERLLRTLRTTFPHVPGDDLIGKLFAAWGDRLSEERLAYVQRCIAEAIRAPGPILQCGSGLLSIAIGMLCEQSENPDKRLWIFEHDRHWGCLVHSWLADRNIKHAHVISAPAEQFEGYVWYVLDPSRLPDSFSLVLSEASSALPGSTRGVVTRMGQHLGNRCVILGRSARRPKDLKFLADWAKAQGAPFVLQEGPDPYLKIALRDQRPASDHEGERLNTAFGPRGV